MGEFEMRDVNIRIARLFTQKRCRRLALFTVAHRKRERRPRCRKRTRSL